MNKLKTNFDKFKTGLHHYGKNLLNINKIKHSLYFRYFSCGFTPNTGGGCLRRKFNFLDPVYAFG